MITSTWVKCNQNHVHFLGIFCCQRRQIIIRRSDAIINTIDDWKCKYHVTFNLSLISFTLFNSSSVRSVYCFNKQFSRGFFLYTDPDQYIKLINMVAIRLCFIYFKYIISITQQFISLKSIFIIIYCLYRRKMCMLPY